MMEQTNAGLNTLSFGLHNPGWVYGSESSASGGGAMIWPASVLSKPSEVAASDSLTAGEKRAILASWASDAWAVESAPALRLSPNNSPPVEVDEILAALRSLDSEEREGPTRIAALSGGSTLTRRVRWHRRGKRASSLDNSRGCNGGLRSK